MARHFARLPRAAAFSIGISLLASTGAAAQTSASSPTDATDPSVASVPAFARQLTGKNVWITADGGRLRGRVASLSAAGLAVVAGGIETTIPYSQIARVEKASNRLRNGALIGVASAATLGLLVGGVSCVESGCTGSQVATASITWAGLGAAAGAGIGAIINAARKNGDVLYDARRSTTTMSLGPIFSPTRKGVAFSMTWR